MCSWRTTFSPETFAKAIAPARTFGFLNPVLVNRSRMIIAGHGRVDAAKLLGMKSVPTICLENLTEDEIRAYILADNRLAEKAGWDNSILAIGSYG